MFNMRMIALRVTILILIALASPLAMANSSSKGCNDDFLVEQAFIAILKTRFYLQASRPLRNMHPASTRPRAANHLG